MRIEFVTNACAIYEARGFSLVSDPWLVDGAFEGSWCHYPPVKTTPEALASRASALYISHAHPDHYDEKTLAAFPRDIPIIIIDQPPNILRRLLGKLGFTNLILSKSGEHRTIGPFEYELLSAFDNHHFQEASLENILDSACFLSVDNVRVMNLNDNIPSAESCIALAALYPSLTMVQVQYTSAGPYPSCISSLSDEQKIAANIELQERYATHTGIVAKLLKPKFIMPFAGQFVIGGHMFEKNKVLGTTTQDHAALRCLALAPDVRPVLLSEGMSIDLPAGQISGGPYCRVSEEEQYSYITNNLSKMRYPYEIYDQDNRICVELFAEAFSHFRAKQAQLNYFPDLVLMIKSDMGIFRADLATGDTSFSSKLSQLVCSRDYIVIETDERLLSMLLKGIVHWNNAMVGMHIDFFRHPERYDPDIYTALSYFHV